MFGGGGTKAASPEDKVDQPPCKMSYIRSKLAYHVGDRVVLSPGGTVLLTPPPETESSNLSHQSLNGSCNVTKERKQGMQGIQG